MLINSLYTVDSFADKGGDVEAALTINVSHPIFAGHFPGQPVLPGVCQMQIIKEVLERAVDKNLFLKEATSCKFLQMINPIENIQLQIAIDYSYVDSEINCRAILKTNNAICLKMSALFIVK